MTKSIPVITAKLEDKTVTITTTTKHITLDIVPKNGDDPYTKVVPLDKLNMFDLSLN